MEGFMLDLGRSVPFHTCYKTGLKLSLPPIAE